MHTAGPAAGRTGAARRLGAWLTVLVARGVWGPSSRPLLWFCPTRYWRSADEASGKSPLQDPVRGGPGAVTWRSACADCCAATDGRFRAAGPDCALHDSGHRDWFRIHRNALGCKSGVCPLLNLHHVVDSHPPGLWVAHASVPALRVRHTTQTGHALPLRHGGLARLHPALLQGLQRLCVRLLPARQCSATRDGRQNRAGARRHTRQGARAAYRPGSRPPVPCTPTPGWRSTVSGTQGPSWRLGHQGAGVAPLKSPAPARSLRTPFARRRSGTRRASGECESELQPQTRASVGQLRRPTLLTATRVRAVSVSACARTHTFLLLRQREAVGNAAVCHHTRQRRAGPGSRARRGDGLTQREPLATMTDSDARRRGARLRRNAQRLRHTTRMSSGFDRAGFPQHAPQGVVREVLDDGHRARG